MDIIFEGDVESRTFKSRLQRIPKIWLTLEEEVNFSDSDDLVEDYGVKNIQEKVNSPDSEKQHEGNKKIQELEGESNESENNGSENESDEDQPLRPFTQECSQTATHFIGKNGFMWSKYEFEKPNMSSRPFKAMFQRTPKIEVCLMLEDKEDFNGSDESFDDEKGINEQERNSPDSVVQCEGIIRSQEVEVESCENNDSEDEDSEDEPLTKLITMTNGKTLILYEGYCYYKKYNSKTFSRWYCTNSNVCQAYIVADNQFKIKDGTKAIHTRFITMVNDKRLVLYQGYTFYKQYNRKVLDKWYCTSQPRCKAYLMTDKDLNIHNSNTEHTHKKKQLLVNSDAKLITMVNGKQLVLYQGYTFYKQYDRKILDKWHCTTHPRCKAFIITDKNLNFQNAQLITMVNGKQLILYQGYTFYKRYQTKKPLDKWQCTSQPRCKAFLILDSDLNIHDGYTEHTHKMKQHIPSRAGYIRV
ncbi:hypothetical protein PYW08_016048 [Mythimna loreyi]|uniref:Uncharacterized protein n=1 Tax=Mythimna loreyi TaxID=667449 RepID=A0ACC2QUD1_9NEOP|nr:hypothetical protein PYW08_016048 [Mythimna loreyi]